MSQDFNKPADWIPFSEIKRPEIKVPQRHELDSDGINKKVIEYRNALVAANPGLDQWSVNKLSDEFKRDVVQASRPIVELRERGQQREQEQREAREAAVAKADAERQAVLDAEIEAEKNRRLRLWTAAGGTEAEFEKGWPELRLEIIRERANALESRARSVSGTHYRGVF